MWAGGRCPGRGARTRRHRQFQSRGSRRTTSADGESTTRLAFWLRTDQGLPAGQEERAQGSGQEELSLVAVHRRGQKRTLEPVGRVLTRADQALQILERYKARLDAVSGSLSALEIEDLVTVRDVAAALQRAEMVRRIAEEIEEYVIELGAEGRLILLQLEELMGGVEDDRRLFVKDYFVESEGVDAHTVLGVLSMLDTECLLDVRDVADVLRLPRDTGLDTAVQARGYRLLHRIPRLPESVADHVVERFGFLHKILRASVPDLVEVEGVGESRARAIKDGLARLAESSILERYV